MITGTGTDSPSPMTVSAYSPDTYVSTMTDFFEAKSAGIGDTPASPKVTDQDIHLFSPSKNDHSRAASESTQDDRTIVPATPSTQSTVRNTSQLDTREQTVNTMSDHHRLNQQEEMEFTPSSPMGQGKQGAMRKGSSLAEETDSQRSVSSASLSTAKGQGHSMQTDIGALQSQHRAQCPMSAGSHMMIGSSEFPMKEPPRGIPQKKCQSRTNPVRSGRPPEGSTEHLTLFLDTVGHGKLPEDYQPAGPPPREIIKQPGDIPDSWVVQSHFFPDAGLGFFFKIKRPYKRRGGVLLAVYYGQDSYTKKFSKKSHKQLTELWSRDGFALSHRGANYVVNGDPACGPAYFNYGFDKVNVYFSYSKANKRMEVRTRGPLDPGKDEALVNYDDPLYPSGYWTREQRNLLPREILARLEATDLAKIRVTRKIPGGPKTGRPGKTTKEKTDNIKPP
jgi:hypothetical protein